VSVLAIVDELAALFEPTTAKRDDAAARPVEFFPDKLYAWPRNERFVQTGTGPIDEERFFIRVAWATDAGGEIAAIERKRETTTLIVAKADALVALLRSHRTGASYENAEAVNVDYESLVTSSVRGFYLDINGYQLRS
jgi:hypothetical protein